MWSKEDTKKDTAVKEEEGIKVILRTNGLRPRGRAEMKILDSNLKSTHQGTRR